MNATRLAWSVRRELWEHRAIYFGPLLVAGIALVALLINARRLSNSLLPLATAPLEKAQAIALMPFTMAASAVLATGWIVAVFYCLEALHAERRDRSILFWKSMPVSDAETVASKVLVALGVVPLAAMAAALLTQVLMVAIASIILATSGGEVGPGVLWSRLPVGISLANLLWGTLAHALWFAPSFAYLLLVSAWSKRAPFLWAFMPIFAATLLEKMAFNTGYVTGFLRDRIGGAMNLAFSPAVGNGPPTRLEHFTPGIFFSSPTLWLGLAAAAVMLTCAVMVRRNREPG
jgi:ABC-2 type transport system permease protein